MPCAGRAEAKNGGGCVVVGRRTGRHCALFSFPSFFFLHVHTVCGLALTVVSSCSKSSIF